MWGFSQTMDGNALSAFLWYTGLHRAKKTRQAAGF